MEPWWTPRTWTLVEMSRAFSRGKTSFSFIRFLQRRDDVQLMSAALDVYTHIFSSILGHQQTEKSNTLLAQVSPSQRPKVKEALQHLQKKMEELKTNLSQMNQEREEVLTKLKNIEVRKVPPQAGFHQPHIHLLLWF